MFVQEGIESFLEAVSKKGLKKKDSSIVYLSGLECVLCNGVFEQKIERELSEEEIHEVVANMDGLPFIWWSGSSKLSELGFDFAGELVGIEMKIDHLMEPSSLDIRQMKSEVEIKLYTDLTLEIFGMSPSVLDEMTEINMCDEMMHFIAYVDEELVGTVSLLFGEEVVGIWNLGTLEPYRRQGIGHQLVNEALYAAQERGYDNAMAVLMPKGLAAGLFAAHGFHEVSKYPFHVYGYGTSLE